jgi:molecular chaperone DnaK
MSIILGIDLGTTFSASALVQEGAPQIVPHGDERIMPSVVGLSPQGGMLVGTPAHNQYLLYPEQTIRSIKRKMGQQVQVALGERSYTPQEISAMILREIKQAAEQQFDTAVSGAVITVPAYFSDAARQATREAGEIAGFTVERIINEPTAAALAYGLDRVGEPQMVAVYDLGGGTFDVSVIELDAGVVEVRASHGNTQLGGDDFDDRLVDWLAERFEREHGTDPRSDRRALARLNRAAEAAKVELSSRPFVRVREEYLLTEEGRPLHLDVEVSRVEFEELISDLIEGTLESLDAALRDAGLRAQELNSILLVGGSTRIPLVREMLRTHTGIEPEMSVNPDEAVALGAAVQAAIIAGEPLDAILVDVTPHSLGIEVAEWQFDSLVPDRYSVIIQRNTTIPTSRSEVYSAVHPSQTAIQIKVYQGEHPVASQNTLLGEFLFDELSSEVAGQPPRITVQFDFDVNGLLHVSAVDRGSGKQARQSFKAAWAHLSAAEIARSRAEIADFDLGLLDVSDEDDEEGESAADLSELTGGNSQLESLLLRARQVHARSSGVKAADLQTAIANLEDALKRGGQEAVEERAEALLDLLYDMDDDEE